MYSIGYDIGSSSVKAGLIYRDTGKTLALASYPDAEMKMSAPKEGWAEQDPELWWNAVCKATQRLLKQTAIDPKHIHSIGIAYQMHGLVLIDKNQKVLRPSIIWCDSRAVQIGKDGLDMLGSDYCFNNLLNSPGNFTASKLKWIKENEPDVYQNIDKILLPGDYIAMKFTGDSCTTISGLSEGIFWDFKQHKISEKLMSSFGFDQAMLPEVVEAFDIQGTVHQKAAKESGLAEGTPITYRAGDQPNNALSLQVFHPGEVAATGGTSGVVYGISNQMVGDKKSRINTFAHVNHSASQTRVGQLLCINGAGSLYAWVRNHIAIPNMPYSEMEKQLQLIAIGSNGLSILPFGNGAERILNNSQIGAHMSNLQFNVHTQQHIYRAALEGIAFAFVYGINAMQELGVNPKKIRVGNDNLFQSSVFSTTVSTLLDTSIEVVNTTGALGAAQASRVGLNDFSSPEKAIESTEVIQTYYPNNAKSEHEKAYHRWTKSLNNILNNKYRETIF